MNDKKRFDLIVIGGGPGGYTAAIAASQGQLDTALVEAGPLGGTCLNRGCIPTKTLLKDTETLDLARTAPFLQGRMKVDTDAIDDRRNGVAQGSREWLRYLLNGNKVTVFSGKASFVGPGEITVTTESGRESLCADRFVLATGAAIDYPEPLTPDGRAVLDTTGGLDITGRPRTVVIVGGGARGVELAQVYGNLGARVALMEAERRLLPAMDKGITGRLRKWLQEKGIKVLTRTRALSARTLDNGRAELEYQSKEGRQTATVDRVILCLSRRPDFTGLNLSAAGLETDQGPIETGPGMMTDVDGIYLIGDAAGSPYWAHKAITQGLTAAGHMLGKESDGRPAFIPSCVYGTPELAGVGLTESQVKAEGIGYKLGEFHFIGNGRAGTLGQSQGLVRILAESSSRQVLGVHIIGSGATEMISLAALAMENGIDLDGIKKTVFAHPSLAESFFEAALAADGVPIHLLLEGVDSDAGI